MTTGLLPQLGALSGIHLGIWSIARLSKDIHSKPGWTVLAFTFLYVPFMHIPTAPIHTFTIAIFLLYALQKNRSDRVYIFKKTMIYCALPLIVFAVYAYVYRNVIIEYTVNPASFYRSGIFNFTRFLIGSNWFLALTILVLLTIFLILAKVLRSSSSDFAAVIILIEFFGPLIFMATAYLLRIGTDYVRFIYFFPTPGILALFYILAQKGPRISPNKTPALLNPKFMFFGFDLAFLIIITGNFLFTQNFYLEAIRRLGLRYSDSLMEMISRIQEDPGLFTVYAPSRPEGTWIEGLTGKATIFPEEIWYINRPGMIARAYAGNLISLAVPLALENKAIYVRNQTDPSGIPYNPNIAIEHYGSYASLVTFQDSFVWIEITKPSGEKQVLNLRDSFQVHRIIENRYHDRFSIRMLYSNSDSSIQVEKTVSLMKGLPQVDIKLVITTRSVNLKQIIIQFVDLHEPTQEELIQRTTISRLERISANRFRILKKDANGKLVCGDLVVLTNPYRISFPEKMVADEPYITLKYLPEHPHYWQSDYEISGNTTQKASNGIEIYRLEDVWDNYHVKYLVVRRTDTYTNLVYSRETFPVLDQNWNYNLYQVP